MPPGPGRGPLRVRRSEGASEGGVRGPVSRRADLMWMVGLAVVGLAAGWSVLSTALADSLAEPNPGAALVWRDRLTGATGRVLAGGWH